MRITESPRLILREYHRHEFSMTPRLFSDPKTMAFWPAPFNLEQIHDWFNSNVEPYRGKGLGRFAVVLKSNNEWIGDAGLIRTQVNGKEEWDLGYIIHADYWGQGYGTEVAKSLVDYVFRYTDMDRIVIHFAEDHHASRRVAQKVGASLEQTFVNERNRGYTHELYVLDRKTFIDQRRERLIRHLGGSTEKQNWLGLATSFYYKDRLLALETAAAIREQIQPELLYWFCNTRRFAFKQKLYQLLDATHQQIANEADEHESLAPLDGEESFRYFIASPNEHALKVQAAMEARRVPEDKQGGLYPLPKGKMQFLKLYSQVAGEAMGTAKEVLVGLFNEVRGY